MADVDLELLTTIRVVLLSLKRSVEMAFQARSREESSTTEILRDFLLDLESARLSFMPADRSRGSFKTIRPYLVATIGDLNRIASNEKYRGLSKLHFRLTHFSTPRDRPKIFPGFEGQTLTIGQALTRTLEYANEYAAPKTMGQAARDLFELRSLVPRQKIAPAQFEIKDGRLVVSKRTSPAQEEDKGNIQSARAELLKNGQRIIKELERSNCDKRLLESVQQLHKLVSDETDAIKIGLANLGCEVMCSGFEHELPTAVASMLKSHTRGVQLFVGQFPEWNRFLENASSLHIENSDVQALKSASDKVIGDLTARPDLVDPEVPKTLAHLSEFLSAPSSAGRRVAFAVLRSVENLISVIFTYGADFAEKTVKKTIDQASTAASKVIVGALLAIALAGAAAIGPIAGKVPEMKWLQTASEIVKKQLQKLGSE